MAFFFTLRCFLFFPAGPYPNWGLFGIFAWKCEGNFEGLPLSHKTARARFGVVRRFVANNFGEIPASAPTLVHARTQRVEQYANGAASNSDKKTQPTSGKTDFNEAWMC